MSKENEFETPNEDEILEILKLIDESDFDELRLEMGGLKMILGKGAIDLFNQELDLTHAGPNKSIVYEEPTPAKSVKEGQPEGPLTPEEGIQKPEPDEAIDVEEEGLVPVKSPLLGIFYRSPKPGAPPFVEVGTYVTEDDTVCLVEVMKLFNTVKAGVKGRIAKVCAENNKTVEYGQTLFFIEPDASS
jgi:acetyl-CoA carboxylase biotin carboxyl carrier protein